MTAEEKLRELYESEKRVYKTSDGTKIPYEDGESIRAEHIDLIANLVIERMRGVEANGFDDNGNPVQFTYG